MRVSQGQSVTGGRVTSGSSDGSTCTSSTCTVEFDAPQQSTQPVAQYPFEGPPDSAQQRPILQPGQAIPALGIDIPAPVISQNTPNGTPLSNPCAYGLCGPMSTVSVGGQPQQYLTASRTVTNNVQPIDTFAARRLIEGADARSGLRKYATIGARDQDYNTAAINAAMTTPEYQREVESLRPIFGDGAEVIARRRVATAAGLVPALANSGFTAADRAANAAIASRTAAEAQAIGNSAPQQVAGAYDPGLYAGTQIVYVNGQPMVTTRGPDGSLIPLATDPALTPGGLLPTLGTAQTKGLPGLVSQFYEQQKLEARAREAALTASTRVTASENNREGQAARGLAPAIVNAGQRQATAALKASTDLARERIRANNALAKSVNKTGSLVTREPSR